MHIGNGGFGPGYGLYPIFEGVNPKSKYSLDNDSVVTMTEDIREISTDCGYAWRESLVVICTFGCTFYGCIDCSTDEMPVFFLDEEEGMIEAPEATSLAEWLRAWVDGRLSPFGRIL